MCFSIYFFPGNSLTYNSVIPTTATDPAQHNTKHRQQEVLMKHTVTAHNSVCLDLQTYTPKKMSSCHILVIYIGVHKLNSWYTVLIDVKVKYIDVIDIWYKPYGDF